MRTELDSPRELQDHVGRELGSSDWLQIDQEQVDRFAEATGDRQWIHVDQERAASGPFGGTIAHGYLTLALAPVIMDSVLSIRHYESVLNYGLNRVRFTAPIPVGSRIRATISVVSVKQRDQGATEGTFSIVYRVDGAERPACIAETVYLYR